MIELQRLSRLPKLFMLTLALLMMIGLALIYSHEGGVCGVKCMRQIAYLLVFGSLALVIALIDTAMIFRWSYAFYATSIALLVLGAICGHSAMGATRWLAFGPIKFQPSELVKIGIVLALSRRFTSSPIHEQKSIASLVVGTIVSLAPFVIVLKQPDLGTATVTLAVSGILFYISGISKAKLAICSLLAITAAPISWTFLLKQYQKQRILTFLNPTADPLGTGYNVIQSEIAVGSGGLFGKGHLESTQAQLDFLPEAHTDFAFALFAEQFGFIGSVLLISLLVLTTGISFYLGINHKCHYCRLVICGLASIFSIHSFVNILMVVGFLPVVGIPLPLISYGGSSLATMLLSFGLIFNMAVSKYSVKVTN